MRSRIFRVLSMLILICLVQVSFAQDRLISLSSSSLTVREAFHEVEQQTGMSIDYVESALDLGSKISGTVKNMPLNGALSVILNGTGCDFTIKGNHIIISRHEQTAQDGGSLMIGGVVKDTKGEPVAGASILETGTSNGTMTDVDGKFSIKAAVGARIQVSFIGFKTTGFNVNSSQSRYDVTLEADEELLNEVVVVGYGTMKKANLTGAVSSVKMDEVLGDRPLTSVSEALQGAIPGLQVTSTSGRPGQDMSFNIRGVNSINSASPLVLVDNVEMDINMLDPNDIESVTVLKDAASSAIYGARAAFGVILVTTKKSANKEKFRLNYSNNFSFSTGINIPEKATPLQTVQAYKDMGYVNYTSGQNVDTWLSLLKEYESNPDTYPEGYAIVDDLRYSLKKTNLFDDMMETGFKKTHNMSFSGGVKSLSYRVGLGYVDQDGILYSSKDSYNRYNLSTYVASDVTKWLTAEMDVKYARSTSKMPYTTASYGIWGAAVAFPSYFPLGEMTIDGEVLPINTPKNFIKLSYPTKDLKNDARIFGKITLKPFKNFDVIGEYTYNYKTLETTQFDKKFEYAHGAQFRKEQSVSNSKYEHSQGNTEYNAINVYADYSISFKEHNIALKGGFNQESNKYSYNYAYRTDMINEELPSLSQATGAYYADDSFSKYTLRGLFYRVTYDYKGKYLFETNGRYDGSSKFPEDNRFGFFPSFSLGWRISKENFMESLKPWLSDLKFRFAWGKIGNQSIEPYAYIPGMPAVKANWVVGDETMTTLQSPKLVSDSFTWEKVATTNFGIDMGAFDNRMYIVFDKYIRRTEGMLAPGMELPAVLGADAPLQNTADLKSDGWELNVTWTDQIGDFKYHIGFNIYDARTKITKYNNEVGLIGSDVYRKGMYLGEIWGYTTDRLYTADDFNADGTLKDGIPKVEGYNPNPGDVLYKDFNGDGLINSGSLTVDDPGDMKIIGNNTRRYQYGISGGVEWKSLSLSWFLQGVGKRDLWIMNELSYPIYSMWSTLYSNQLDYWTESNTNSYFPRLYQNSEGNTKANRLTQTRYLSDGSYLSIKNITLTYSLPKKWISKIKLENAYVFFSGENLWTFDNLPKGLDAERVVTSDLGARGFSYPYMRQFSFGVNITL